MLQIMANNAKYASYDCTIVTPKTLSNFIYYFDRVARVKCKSLLGDFGAQMTYALHQSANDRISTSK